MQEFEINSSCYVNDKFIGTTVAKKAIVKLLDDGDYLLEDKDIDIKTGIEINNAKEYQKLGTYTIPKPDTEEVSGNTSFTGYDYMKKFDTLYVDSNTYPIRLDDCLENLCSQVGLTLGNKNFPNNSYMLKGNPFTNKETRKTVLSNLVQLAGGFAEIDVEDGKLYVRNLDVSGEAVETIDGNNYDEFKPNNVFGPVNSVRIQMNSGVDGEETIKEAEGVTDENRCQITIADNYYLTSAEEREAIINGIFNALNGLTYLPIELSYYGYPWLKLGDKIKVKDKDDKEYVTYVMEHTLKYNGAYSGTIKAIALTKTQQAYKEVLSLKEWRRNTELAVDKINGKITSIAEETTENSQKINKVEQDVDGTTAKISLVENETNSKIDELKHTVEGISNQFSENGGNNLFYYDKEYWKGGDVTTVTLKDIQLGDDLSGKKLVLSFPDGVSLGEELVADMIIGTEGHSISVQQMTDTSTGNFTDRIVIIENGLQSIIYKYDQTNSEIINNYEEYMLSDSFGVVTELNNSIEAFNYIKVEESRTEQVLNIEEYRNTEFVNNSKSGFGYIVNKGSSKQSIEVQNGTYTISFKYKKIASELANTSVKINGEEYSLTSTEWSNFKQTVEISANYIEVEFISDTNNALYVADLLANIGTEQDVWTQNPNETRTDTVTIGKGIKVKSSTTNTELKADSDGIRIDNTQTNKTVAEFTDKGTETEELVVRGQAQISGILIQQVDNQTWISSLL